MYKTFFKVSVFCALVLCGCDLQPKISSIPDNIGMFIQDRYPALLADPYAQPEIYNSAVTDYGVYASPELYGSANIDDYVLYSSIDDYVLVPEEETEEEIEPLKVGKQPEIEYTKIDQSEKNESETEQPEIDDLETEQETDYLVVPLYGGNTVIDKEQEPEKKEPEIKSEKSDTIIVVKGDTVYSLARKNGMSVSEFAQINNLHEPYKLSIGQKLTTQRVSVKQEIPNVISTEKVKELKAEKIIAKEDVKAITNKTTQTKRVNLQEITVQKGDTLYSLSRKYKIPVNDLAVMNKLSSPFSLSVGQKLKVPEMENVKTVSVATIKTASSKTQTSKITPAKKATVKKDVAKTNKAQTVKETNTKSVPKQQKSLNAKKQTPKMVARSNSKFSWPLRGKILSAYGSKNNGLFNDGINIAAPIGTVVKAAENGIVAYAGNEVKGMGNLIIIQHSDGWMTIYSHLDSMLVKRGARVNVGTQIGRAGKTGKVDRPQLHFEIRKGTKAYNPTQYLKK